MELIELYRQMARVRAFELALADLWNQGLISGEMHLGTGEEAVVAGVAAHLKPGDAVALDHRCTPMLMLLGVDPVLMLKEMLGRTDGLCGGQGGHMHLMSREHLAAASGIVGAAGPLGAGFALAAKMLRPGSVAVAFFGDGAVNQGMLMESFNLAACWSLPLVFICKDNGWAITTRSSSVTGGDVIKRAAAFGLSTWDVDGLDAMAVHEAAGKAVDAARRGKGPGFLRASCARLDGHFLGDLMVRTARSPMDQGKQVLSKVVSAAFTRGGGGVGARAASMAHMMGLLHQVKGDSRDSKRDPMVRVVKQLRRQKDRVERIDQEVAQEVRGAVEQALQEEVV